MLTHREIERRLREIKNQPFHITFGEGGCVDWPLDEAVALSRCLSDVHCVIPQVDGTVVFVCEVGEITFRDSEQIEFLRLVK